MNDPIAKSGFVGGLTVKCLPFYARGGGMALAAEALDIAGPALAKLAGTLKPDQLQAAAGQLPTTQLVLALAAELGVDGIIAELLGIVRRLYVDNPDRGDRFVAKLLSQTSVVQVVGNQAGEVMLDDPSRIDLVVGCNLGLLFNLCRFALEVNFAGFFAGLSSTPPAGPVVARDG